MALEKFGQPLHRDARMARYSRFSSSSVRVDDSQSQAHGSGGSGNVQECVDNARWLEERNRARVQRLASKGFGRGAESRPSRADSRSTWYRENAYDFVDIIGVVTFHTELGLENARGF